MPTWADGGEVWDIDVRLGEWNVCDRVSHGIELVLSCFQRQMQIALGRLGAMSQLHASCQPRSPGNSLYAGL